MSRDRDASVALEVIEPGLLLTVEDAGRPRLAAQGIPHGGAADAWSLAVANALLGNPLDAAVLEATILGPVLRARRPVTVAIAGTMTGRVLGTGERVAPGTTVTLGEDETIALDPAHDGARGYVAVPGGVDVPLVLGSRSTIAGAGIGGQEGRALRAGDAISPSARDLVRTARRWPGRPSPPGVTGDLRLRVLPGPHAPLVPGAIEHLVGRPWTVSPTSSRVGLRLEEVVPDVPRAGLPSLGVVEGSIQLPPDGRPIVLLADHQPTGGYPVVAVVVTADLARLGQLGPGMDAWFALATLGEARDALAELDRRLAAALGHLAGGRSAAHGGGPGRR